MEFWGVEVPSGKPLTCKPGAASYVHVSQAALGENKTGKGADRVVLKVTVDAAEVVVGTLSQGKCDQTTLDLIFEKDFVLSHNSSGSVYFCGYKTDAVRDDVSGSSDEEDEFDVSDEDEEEEALQLAEPSAKENGKVALKAKVAVPANKPLSKSPPTKSPAAKVEVPVVEVKPKAKPAVIEKKGKDVTEESDDEDEEEDDEDDDEDDEMLGSGSEEEDDSDSDEEDDSDDEDESEEDQSKSGKKRPAPAVQVATPGKKSKIATTAGKPEPKTPSVPASTPKQQQQSAKKDLSAKKTPGKENSNTPASGKKLGQHFCQPCSKSFTSESALTQHKAAKHK